MFRFSVPNKSLLSVLDQLELLKLPPAKRKRVLRRIGKEVVMTNRVSMRAQHTPDGQAWPKRKGGKGKMFRKLPRKFKHKADPNKVVMTWQNHLAAKTAYAHQHGIPEQFDAVKARKLYGKPDYDAPATRTQAKKLRELGYTIPAKRKGKRKKPSLKYIVQTMSQGQAGLTIRLLDGEKNHSADWDIKLPARKLVAVDDKQVQAIVKDELKRMRET